MRIPLLSLLCLGIVSVSSLPVSAQNAPAAAAAVVEVEVNNVKFSTARLGGDVWLESEVELTVKPGGRSVTGEFVDRVRVTLSFMVEATDSREGSRQVFYRSSVEAITLEGGRSTVRFYLPPEVVKRDRLRGDVKFFVVDLEVGGRPLELTRGAFARDFTSQESVNTFKARVSSESGATEGVLMPQYLTPFASDTRRASPTLLRSENLR